MKIVNFSVDLVTHTPNPEQLIERMGRLCYKSEDLITPTSAPDFISKRIIKGGINPHESVLEHASATVIVTCDRAIANEIVRHRIASYSQTSTRYCNFSKEKFGGEITVVTTPDIVEGTRGYEVWIKAMEEAEKGYFELLALGYSPQIARDVLPLDLATEIGITCNFRSWRNFIKLRAAKESHPKIRLIARQIHSILMTLAPSVFEDLKVTE